MQTFLGKVAAAVLTKHKAQLQQVVVVLPTRRACLFFRRELSEQISNPVWSPQVIAINDFILSITFYLFMISRRKNYKGCVFKTN